MTDLPEIKVAAVILLKRSTFHKLLPRLPIGAHFTNARGFTDRNNLEWVIMPEVPHNIYMLRSAVMTKNEWFPVNFVIGPWECENSPWMKCLYDHTNDPVHDFCIFCGEPEERK